MHVCFFKIHFFLPKCASLHPPLFWGVGHIPVLSKVRSRISGDLLEVLPMKGSWTAHEVTLALRLHRPAPHLTLRLFVGNEPMDSDRGSWSVFKTVLCRVQFGFEKKFGECCIPLYFWLSTDIWYIQLCGCQTHLGRHSQTLPGPTENAGAAGCHRSAVHTSWLLGRSTFERTVACLGTPGWNPRRNGDGFWHQSGVEIWRALQNRSPVVFEF